MPTAAATAPSPRALHNKTKVRDTRPQLLSGEGIAAMAVAMLFDFVPPLFVLTLNLFFGIGELISWPLDILATIVLGGWMWLRGGTMTTGKKAAQFAKRRLPWFAGEFVPGAGVLPLLTISTFLFLKK